jgi:hypothetical protein
MGFVDVKHKARLYAILFPPSGETTLDAVVNLAIWLAINDNTAGFWVEKRIEIVQARPALAAI